MLASGSNGNCAAIHANGNTLLVDCGISLRMLRQGLKETGVDESTIRGILVTHGHTDHTKGLEKTTECFGVPIFAAYPTAEKLQEDFPDMISASILEVGTQFSLSGFEIRTFPVEHDVHTIGYTFAIESTKVGYATDCGKATVPVEFNLRDCNTLVLESNYDVNMLVTSNRSWALKQRICNGAGHLSNDQNSELLPRILTNNTRNLILAHISHDCNKYDLALKTARKTLDSLNRQDVFLDCGRREGAIPTVWC